MFTQHAKYNQSLNAGPAGFMHIFYFSHVLLATLVSNKINTKRSWMYSRLNIFNTLG